MGRRGQRRDDDAGAPPTIGDEAIGARPRYARAPVLLCAVAVAAAAVLAWTDSDAHRFLFGARDPVLPTALACALCLLGLRVLERLEWVAPGVPEPRVLARLASLGAALALPVVVIDVFGAFPAEMNVSLPDALLFYPSIAVVAESTFHVVPLAAVGLITRATGAGRGGRGQPGGAWVVAAAGASVIEPALQVAWGLARSPLWANAYVGVHLLGFNAIGVWLIRRHGFAAVWCYRMSYYLIWHVAWGVLRLELLFGAPPG